MRAAADQGDGRRHLRRHPALLRVRPGGVERRRDGRLQPGRVGGPVGLHAAAPRPAPQLLALGEAQRAVRQLLRERAGPVVPEPPVLDRRAVGRRARQPAAQAEPHARLATRSAATRPASSSWRSSTARAIPGWSPPCFDFETEGDLLNDAGIPWSYYAASEQQKGYIWSAYSRDPPLPPEPEALAGAHPARRPGGQGHRARTPAARSRGSPPASRSPSIPSTASATARTAPRR